MNQLKEKEMDEKIESEKIKNLHVGSIDGLRAISVVFVMLYHLMPHVFVGGYLGVIVFFVLSGYFITDNILVDLETGEKFSLLQFWKRRFSKLYLPYLPFLCIVSLVVLGFYHQALENFTYNLLSSLFGVNNIYQILNQLSYFENYGKLNPFTHLWFMGVEIQFYLIFPLVLLALHKVFSKHRGQMAFMIFAVSVFSALMMYGNYIPDTDISRIYYGSDTRVFSLLIGSMFAMIFPKNKIVNLNISRLSGAFYSVVSAVFLGVLCVAMYYIQADFPYLYPLVMYGLSFLSGLLIVLLLIQENLVAKLLSLPPISTIGKRSYSLYLWQYAVMIFVNHEFLWSRISKWNLLAINLAITFVISEISYQLFEKKRKRSLKFSLYKFRAIALASLLGIMAAIYLPLAMPERFHYTDELSELKDRIAQLEEDESNPVISKVEVPEKKEESISDVSKNLGEEKVDEVIKRNNDIIENAQNLQDADEVLKKILEEPQEEPPNLNLEESQGEETQVERQEESQGEEVQVQEQAEQGEEKELEAASNPNELQNTTSDQESNRGDLEQAQDLQAQGKPAESPQEGELPKKQEPKPEEEPEPQEVKPQESKPKEEENPAQEEVSKRFTFIGDSVMLGAKPSIQQAFQNSNVNAKVSRQSWHLGGVLNEMQNQNQLYENVVIHLGTNGYIDKSEFIRVLKNLGERNIYLINSVVPRSWEESVNSVINEVASELSNVHVIDWYSLAKGKREWFYKDAIHPNLDGIEKYTQLIKNSVK